MNGWMSFWADARFDGWTSVCMYGWMDRWMDELMDGWTEGWKDA